MINSRAAYRTAPLAVLLICIAACAAKPSRHHTGADLTILSLNLHTYQELRAAGTAEAKLTNDQARQRIEAYGPIFDRIAAGIDALDPDLICLQEVGEWSTDKASDPASRRTCVFPPS